jgi:hypothetical protein
VLRFCERNRELRENSVRVRTLTVRLWPKKRRGNWAFRKEKPADHGGLEK